MTRSRRGSADGAIRWLARNLPWYFCLAMAAAGYVVIGKVMPQVLSGPTHGQPVLGLFFSVLAMAWATAFGIGGVASFLRSSRYRQLLLGQQSVQNIRGLHWRDFERLLAAYYVRQGFVVDITGGGGADGGVDLVLKRLDHKALVQAKNWKTSSVGVSVVREMRGLMAVHRAAKGIVVCSGTFTKDALQFGSENGVELIDGQKLAAMVRSVNGGELLVKSTACPQCGGEMSVRFNRKERTEFMGCSNYPRCKGTREMGAFG